MPQKAVTTQKETLLSLRASEPEKTILMQAALVDQSEFRLSPDQWKAFCDRLDAPAKVIPALRQLFSEPEPGTQKITDNFS